MAGDRTIFDEPHHQSLELLAAQALSNGNAGTAFRLADRRCRILPQPEPHCYVLRGEASFFLGSKAAAIDDIERALAIAPDNIAANRRMLAWADGSQQLQAAYALIGQEHNFDQLRKAIQVLIENGQRNFSNMVVLEDAIEGWVLWQDEAPLELSISDSAHSIRATLEPSPFHPLGDFGHATSFSVRRPKSANAQSILLSIRGSVLQSTRTAGNIDEPKMRIHWPRPANARNQPVTVIVPIYGDYEATRLCLDSLQHELNSGRHRAIFVDDATPDPQIAKYVAKFEAEPYVDVLVNTRNLGFTGSVNRALAQVKQGDVIILNSDTIVPPGFIDRLVTASQSSPKIGTVTPLSNNGEFTSFPIPNTANPLGLREDIERIDAFAAKLNSDRVIDIPSGIGFCLFVTRACLDSVGVLSDDFGAGYLEDADFCLRARERGFRNVCAPSIYVGHAGSKSFGQEKRSLVVHNLSILERRYPSHRPECGAFIVADPLKTARQAIERVATASFHPRLLVTGIGAISAVARERAREVASETEPAMILEVRNRADEINVKIINADGGMPQSLEFDLASSDDCGSLIDFLQKMQPSRIEIFDPAKIPVPLVNALLRLKVPYDIFIADSGLLGPNSAQHSAAAVRLGSCQSDAKQRGLAWVNPWRKIADGAQHILVPCPMAEAFATRFLPHQTIKRVGRSAVKGSRNTHAGGKRAMPHLAFVPVRSCAHEQWLMREITHKFNVMRPDVSLTIMGTTLDDLGLMRSRNVFATGAVAAEEFEHLIGALGISQLFVSTTRPLFGHPILYATHSSNLPMAYFDWSKSGIKSKKRDLAISPRSSLNDITGALNEWMPKL
jgi:GT2 family glycosyltransferase